MLSSKHSRCAAVTWVILILTAVSGIHAGKTVHVIYSNHLDIGFDGIHPVLGTDDNVINKYFDVYFPRAIQTAKQLQDAGDGLDFIWTTQSYLISLYLDCPPGMGLHCPSARERAAVEDAIREGSITWHAFPHNAQLEFMDSSMVIAGLQLTHRLDRRFGLPLKQTMSQRDVPGLTRGAVPVLAGTAWWYNGIKAISVGVNGGSAPPDVPKGMPFVWKDPGSRKQLLAMWHPGGYSGRPVDFGKECIQAEGFNHILCCAWRGDNAGPHSPAEVRNITALLQKSFPGAEVKTSTFDDFIEPLAAAVAGGLNLPEVTAEIGDTWIHGVASDAAKTAEYRALQRMRRRIDYDHSQDASFQNFSRLLLKVPEHTWGVDVKDAMPDYRNWSNADFAAALAAGRYDDAVHSWRRQRAYLDWALEALEGNARLGCAALAAVQRTRQSPVAAVVNGGDQWRALPRRSMLRSHAWEMQLDPHTGAISHLRRRWRHRHGASWAKQDSLLGQVTYSTYSEQDYQAIWERYAYLPNLPEWFYKDFGKPNCSRFAGARRADVTAAAEKIYAKQTDARGFLAAAQLKLSDQMVNQAGAPAAVWLYYLSPPHSDSLYLDVVWVDKTATRLPEALWVDWQPSLATADPGSWRMWKLDTPISPLEVLRNGSQSLHGVSDRGVDVRGKGSGSWERLSIRSLDAALVSPGEPTPFPNPDRQPDLRRGMHSLIANNIWGTNYVMWQPWRPEDATRRFRFVLQMEDMTQAPQKQASSALEEEWDVDSWAWQQAPGSTVSAVVAEV